MWGACLHLCRLLLPRTFSTFLDQSCIINQGMFTFFAWVSRFASVTDIIKYVEKLLIFACLVFSRTFCETVYKFQKSCFDELSFLPMTWSAVFNKLWRRSIFKFCGYMLAEAVRFVRFKSEFIIIGRGCLVLLKRLSMRKPCKTMQKVLQARSQNWLIFCE